MTGAPAVRAFLTQIRTRLVWIAAAYGAAAGFALALLVTRSALVAAAFGTVGAVAGLFTGRRPTQHIAQQIERRAPSCRNVLLTASEIIGAPAGAPSRVPQYIREIVCNDAARIVHALSPSQLFPMTRAMSVFGVSAAAWAAVSLLAATNPTSLGGATAPVIASASIRGISVTITPPAYAEQPAHTLRDPTRIDALEGSRIAVRVNAEAATVAMETLRGQTRMTGASPGEFTGDILADADGFIAIQPATTDGRVGVRRLIGVSVRADNAPRVRITAPGRDQLLPDARRTIDVAITADDDLALASLRLRYTKVSGSGEQFTFSEGELPVMIVRANSREWTARGTLRLDSLRLTAGDMLVYRAVAADRRPGAPPSESDAFIVEIAAPGAVAGGGFAIDDQEDRYGVSQQMVILFTERLIAGRASLSPAAIAEEAQRIAAAQRQVRAEFVFMLGGELAEDVLEAAGTLEVREEAHVAADDEAIAGRLANQGRLDLLRAIRSMSAAASALASSDLQKALTDERAALTSLQRAFSRTRYILRTLTARERIDFSRRLTGTLAGAFRDAGPSVEADAPPRVVTLRRALADIATTAAADELGASEATLVSAVAERVLRVDPSDTTMQRVASTLATASSFIEQTQTARARAALDSAAIGLTRIVRSALVTAPARTAPLAARLLEGALVDALRNPRRNP